MSPFVYSSADDAIYVDVVTTTIFSTVPSSTSSSPPSTSVPHDIAFPFASVVGGSCAGIFLALAAVIGWKLWGRAIKRKDEILRKETVSSLLLKNTRIASCFMMNVVAVKYHYENEHPPKRVDVFSKDIYPHLRIPSRAKGQICFFTCIIRETCGK
jgi:hypothetical protein